MKEALATGSGNLIIDVDVVAQYAGSVAVECFGIVGMAAVSMSDGIAKMLKKENLTSCLSWCVDGCREWIKHGLGEVPPAAKAAADAYYKENDLLGQWLDERTENCAGGFLLFDKALSDFNDWLTVGGTGTRYQRKGFTEAMERHGKAKIRKSNGTGYPDLCIRCT